MTGELYGCAMGDTARQVLPRARCVVQCANCKALGLPWPSDAAGSASTDHADRPKISHLEPYFMGPVKEPSSSEERESRLRTEGFKDDFSKQRWDVVPSYALQQVSEVMTFGAKKYAAHNYRIGMKWSRLLNAAFRHLFAWLHGEENDEESGVSHLAHAACCILMILDLQILSRGEDDRWKSDAYCTDPTDP